MFDLRVNGGNNDSMTGISKESKYQTLESTTSMAEDKGDALRQNAVRELLETEINYINLLSAICDGYLPAMSNRLDVFSLTSLQTIFCDIITIYKFQQKFLEALRKGIKQNEISKVFLKMYKGFLCYSSFCNSFSSAVKELQIYERVKEAREILENCRQSRKLNQLPLSAHLLAPVQRICRYPLYLSKLNPYGLNSCTNELRQQINGWHYEQIDVFQFNIPDTPASIVMAQKKMEAVIKAVNETRRQNEIIARFQASLQSFKGPQISIDSTRFFIQASATRINNSLWNSNFVLLLFDNQLIYCKRDIIKSSQLTYKGRLYLDCCSIMNIRDGTKLGIHTVKNCIRIYCRLRAKWLNFSFRSMTLKYIFLKALALERQFCGKVPNIDDASGILYDYSTLTTDFWDSSELEILEVGAGMAPQNYVSPRCFAELKSNHLPRHDNVTKVNYGSESLIYLRSKLSDRRPLSVFYKTENAFASQSFLVQQTSVDNTDEETETNVSFV